MQEKTQAILAGIQGVIFDLDGTLVESSLNFQKIRDEIGCPQGIDTLKYISGLSPERQQICEEIVVKHELLDARQAQSLPGAEQLVATLNNKGMPQAIVTRNCVAASELKLKNNHFNIDILITREQYPPKPAPDALLAIAQQWQIAPHRLMYVGDFKYDISAANNAGMISCFISHGKQTDYSHEADLVFAQLDELNRYF